MDPLTGFVSIVGLISIFKQERKAQEDQNAEVFYRWLDEHRHEELKEFILRSKELPSEIDRALQEDHEVIIAKLEKINGVLANLVSKVEGVAGIAHALCPNPEVSDEAISILRQLINSSSKGFIKVEYKGGEDLMLTNGCGGNINIEDTRFLDDDLATLVNLGLLHREYTSTGNESFSITRNAVKFLEAVSENLKN